MSKSAKDNAAARGITAHLLMPEPSLGDIRCRFIRKITRFSQQRAFPNERPPPLLHFAFFPLHFAFPSLSSRSLLPNRASSTRGRVLGSGREAGLRLVMYESSAAGADCRAACCWLEHAGANWGWFCCEFGLYRLC